MQPALEGGLGEARTPVARRTIPFEYAFRYNLEGKPDNVLRKTVAVSVEATFVAVSIGYGVMPRVTPIRFGIRRPPAPPAVAATVAPGAPATLPGVIPSSRLPFRDLPLDSLIESLSRALGEELPRGEIGPRVAEVLMNGFKLNPDLAPSVLMRRGATPIDPKVLEVLFQAVAAPPREIQFKYAIFDDGSGREFQSEPILNVAGLGISDGDRPFRYFAQPIVFAPRSIIRMEVTEVSAFRGELHVSLQGFKALGGASTPTGRMRRSRRPYRRT